MSEILIAVLIALITAGLCVAWIMRYDEPEDEAGKMPVRECQNVLQFEREESEPARYRLIVDGNIVKRGMTFEEAVYEISQNHDT